MKRSTHGPIAKANDDYAGSFPSGGSAISTRWWPRTVTIPVSMLYSIGNEIPSSAPSLAVVWGRTLAERVRDLDPTRLVTNGINPLLACAKDLLGSGGRCRCCGARASGRGRRAERHDDHDGGSAWRGCSRSKVVTEQMQEAFAILDVGGYNYGESRYELDGELFPNRLPRRQRDGATADRRALAAGDEPRPRAG